MHIGTWPSRRSATSSSSRHSCFHTPIRLSQLLVLLLALCALLADAAAGDLDYWKILGLKRGASDADIKKSYRKLSKKYHPDKNKAEDAEQRFVEVSQAYEVLSDEEKRDIYNKYGHDGLRQHAQTGSAQHHSPFDIFSQFFGGHGGHSQQQVRRGPKMVMDMEVDLQDVYTGKTYEITIQRKQICDHCTGTGAKTRDDVVDCHVCQGRGVRIVKHMLAPGMYQQVQMQCDHCNARGKVIKHACPVCKGARIVQAESEVSVDIDRGLPEGAELVFEGEADENPDWQAGDLIVRVRTKPMMGGFMRRGSNLYWKETIGVADALLGFERDLPHFDNHSIKLKSPTHGGTIQPGHVEVLHGEGLPRYHSSEFGDLFVEYNVVLPEKVSDKAAEKLKEAFGLVGKTSAHQEL